MTNGLTNSASTASTWWKSFNDSELDSLIQRAVRSNLDLRVAEARLRQARAVRERSAADLMPAVDASASYARQLQSENQPLIGALPLPPNFPFEYNVYNAGFDASWEIDIFGGKRRALQAATAEWQGTIEARNDALVSLLAEMARNYVELRGNQSRLEIARQNLKLQEEAVELTRARFQTGVANELDVTRAAALLAGIRAERSCSASNRANWWPSFHRFRRCRRCHRKFRSDCRPICCAAVRTCVRLNGNWRPRQPASAWRPRNGSPNFRSPVTSGR
jgi:multidrug efflux system outer membrane protein